MLQSETLTKNSSDYSRGFTLFTSSIINWYGGGFCSTELPRPSWWRFYNLAVEHWPFLEEECFCNTQKGKIIQLALAWRIHIISLFCWYSPLTRSSHVALTKCSGSGKYDLPHVQNGKQTNKTNICRIIHSKGQTESRWLTQVTKGWMAVPWTGIVGVPEEGQSV